ncbi:GNAT superfamily N-acetyltransferase [Agromyces flavus]|uniref:Acetyltransferase (GNAT) family protein n=1 Tax=Agromyces flavus TaxID=589382 RepID=A0A1H1LAS1_9MICO|nr:GNAT family N-acetyltransferase [Agromyces flavus]MCP2367492.1 GNAT superfamily N-acetyltransferase [Agromyces flavus]GGI45623.1 N-acetyltransferase [Agromyces flavus]SDR71460.1 Acetyltransferase (GNAT) family protein [Agromyces flavus]
MGDLTVRAARAADARDMARVIVQSWRETYRGVVPDRILDDPGFEDARERFWTAALTEERYRANRIAVAERDGRIVGVAMSGPIEEAGSEWTRQLYVLYVVSGELGSGAGTELFHHVIRPDDAVALWVADPNPRAQAFYRKQGFIADGAETVDDGIREIRMVRPASAPG